MSLKPLSWQQLAELTDFAIEPINGQTNAQSTLRLFGQTEADVRVTLFRDNHAWCPYCQKIWLWLEEQQVPYRIEKVTMFCYGKKESWYKQKVPSGMLPAVELDGKIITESDDILLALEQAFGVLYRGMQNEQVLLRRRLERLLFRAWCGWLCQRAIFPGQEQKNRQQFIEAVGMVEDALASTPGAYFLE
ncbi:MAG: glutathione S-transferase N-terminal domain-containing protein, partial [Cyanobacteria bacterium J06607_15]